VERKSEKQLKNPEIRINGGYYEFVKGFFSRHFSGGNPFNYFRIYGYIAKRKYSYLFAFYLIIWNQSKRDEFADSWKEKIIPRKLFLRKVNSERRGMLWKKRLAH